MTRRARQQVASGGVDVLEPDDAMPDKGVGRILGREIAAVTLTALVVVGLAGRRHEGVRVTRFHERGRRAENERRAVQRRRRCNDVERRE